jgi:hypothetical protein
MDVMVDEAPEQAGEHRSVSSSLAIEVADDAQESQHRPLTSEPATTDLAASLAPSTSTEQPQPVQTNNYTPTQLEREDSTPAEAVDPERESSSSLREDSGTEVRACRCMHAHALAHRRVMIRTLKW